MKLLRLTQSVFAAAFGVQSSANRDRDFTQGNPVHFVVGGVIFTALFILTIWLLVQFILATA